MHKASPTFDAKIIFLKTTFFFHLLEPSNLQFLKHFLTILFIRCVAILDQPWVPQGILNMLCPFKGINTYILHEISWMLLCPSFGLVLNQEMSKVQKKTTYTKWCLAWNFIFTNCSRYQIRETVYTCDFISLCRIFLSCICLMARHIWTNQSRICKSG